jgi:hypothetical protein
MNSAINHILKDIYNKIPIEILKEAFIPQTNYTLKSLDDYIIEKIIEGRILDDCNIGGGRKKLIELKPEYLKPYKFNDTRLFVTSNLTEAGVYEIPPEVRDNRNITEVIELKFPSYMDPLLPYNGRSVGNKAKDLLYTLTYKNMEYLPKPILLGNNLVTMDPPMSLHITSVLVCFLEYDKYFTNLNNAAIRPLCDLCTCATKAYIYNKLYIRMARSIDGTGVEIGAFKDKVDSYADEEERYNELLLKFRGGATLDSQTITEIIGMSFY